MKKLFRESKDIIEYLSLVQKSNFSFWDKCRAFWTMLSIHYKSAFIKNKKLVNQKIFDFKVTAYDYDNLKYLFKEIFLGNEYYFEYNKTSPGIIDCGANIGMAVLFFKKLFPDATIIAIEPNPFAFELLQKNVTQNNLSNVILHNSGLSDSDGELEFFISEDKGTLLGSIMSERGGTKNVIVKSMKLSSLMDEQQFDLVKIDVEGAETMLVKDLLASEKMSQGSRYIIEYHHRINQAKSSLSSFIKYFEDQNYEYNIRSDFDELGSFQDILLSFYKDEEISNEQPKQNGIVEKVHAFESKDYFEYAQNDNDFR